MGSVNFETFGDSFLPLENASLAKNETFLVGFKNTVTM